MDDQMKWEIKNCFCWHDYPAECRRAIGKVESYLNQIDFNDDDDLEQIIDIALIALRQGEGDVGFVEYLISVGFDINSRLLGKDCLILRAAENRLEPVIFEKLAALGADLYSERSNGDNVLSLTADEREDLAVWFVENCELGRLDKADKFGITPLMYAAMADYVRLTRTLLARGSDVNAAGTGPLNGFGYWLSMDGVTPLALALRHGNVEVARLLLEAGADETLCDTRGNPPIFSLLRYPYNFFKQLRFNDPIFGKKCEMLSLLKELELTDEEGYTVLMRSLCSSKDSFDLADAYDNQPISLALIERGANLEAVGNDGRRPLHLAVLASGDVEKALVKAGADLNAQDNDGNTPLLTACRRCDEKTVRYLVKAGADASIRNNKGEDALEIAAERGYSDAVELMLERPGGFGA